MSSRALESGRIGNGGDLGVQREGNHLVAERFEHTDVNNLPQMQTILAMVKDPENMKHLAGISPSTSISDIIQHYKKEPKERDGRVLLDGDEVVGVFEICPMDFSRLAIKPEEDPSWQIRSGILNRLCMRSDVQQKGRGTKAVAYAEDIAFTEYDYSTLIAAIILDPDQKKAYNKALKDGTINEFVDDFKNNDARGKVFLRNRKWKFSGVLRDQGGFKETEPAHVMLVQKTRVDWDKEQKQLQRRNTPKAT